MATELKNRFRCHGQQFVTLALIVLGIACVAGPTPTPLCPVELPTTDIVFQRYPAEGYDSTMRLGFINADGSNFEEQELMEDPGGLPTWSADGNWIFYRWGPALTHSSTARGYVAVAGRHTCNGTMLWGGGRLRAVPGQGNSVLTPISGIDDPYIREVAIVDPISCKEIEIIYSLGHSEKIGLYNPTLSVDGLLALLFFNPYDNTEAGATIKIINLETKTEIEVGHGVAPSWSPDGQWLTYTARDGIYLTQFDGSASRRVVDYDSYQLAAPIPVESNVWRDWPPYPEWSPDGRQLVYHLWENGQYNIHKLNLETGDDTIIFEGGLYPHWRWSSSASSDTVEE